MDKPILHIKQLSIGYQFPIVKDINVALGLGSFCVLLGANGKGKSTLINTIRKSIHSISGEILLDGKNTQQLTEQDLSKLISIVSTDRNFAPNLTVFDILSFGRIPHLGLLSNLQEKDLSIINNYIDLLDLASLAGKRFNELSDGQKQRVMICRALIQDTPIILLDEPTAHLDIENKIKIFTLLQQLVKDSNKTILCSTHEVSTAMDYADTFWLINKEGKFIFDATNNQSEATVLKMLF